MKWFRVDCSIADQPMIGALADALGVSIAEATGLHALVWAKLPEHAPDGALAVVPNGTLERWVSWGGKRGAFAEAYRVTCCDETGVALDWERVNGAAMRESEATTERVRKLREGKKRTTAAPEAVTAPVRRTAPVRTPTHGNGTSDGTDRGTAENTDPAQPERSPQIPVEKSVEKAAERPAPPAAVAEMNRQPPRPDALPPAEPSAVLNRFVAKFYAGAGKDRRADIARQTNAILNGQGVKRKGNVIRAVDSDHLDQILLEVMEEPPRDHNAAMVFVLDKLNDTYLDVLSSRAKSFAGELRERPRAAPPPAGMPGDAPMGATPIRAAIAGVMEGLDLDGDEADVPRETGET